MLLFFLLSDGARWTDSGDGTAGFRSEFDFFKHYDESLLFPVSRNGMNMHLGQLFLYSPIGGMMNWEIWWLMLVLIVYGV